MTCVGTGHQALEIKQRSEAVSTIYGEMSRAYRAGRDTAITGQPRRNPHNGNADTARERVLSVIWARGYQAGDPFRAGGEFDSFAGG